MGDAGELKVDLFSLCHIKALISAQLPRRRRSSLPRSRRSNSIELEASPSDIDSNVLG